MLLSDLRSLTCLANSAALSRSLAATAVNLCPLSVATALAKSWQIRPAPARPQRVTELEDMTERGIQMHLSDGLFLF